MAGPEPVEPGAKRLAQPAQPVNGPQSGLLPLEQAQQVVLEQIRPQPTIVRLDQAYDLILASDLVSTQHSPLFDNSAMDGFAVRLSNEPQRTVVGTIAAGDVWQGQLESDQAVRIMTGAEVPASAEAVVPIEEIETLAENRVRITALPRPGQHIRRRGEEYGPGDLLLPAGTRLNAAAIGLLAGQGQAEVQVYKRPVVGILATGSELLPVSAPLAPGKLRDSNSLTLAACVREAGAEPICYGILPDEPDAIRAGLTRAFAECDLVLTSGGVSVGDFDYVQEILLKMGLERHFWKVAIKPGKPVLFGSLAGKPLFGIPGNPASAMTVFELLVRPALQHWLGRAQIWRPQAEARLSAPVRAATDRLLCLRGSLHDGIFAPLRGQSSSNLLSVAQAQAMLLVRRDYGKDELVRVWVI